MCTTPPEVISYQVFHWASSSQDISGVVASGAVSTYSCPLGTIKVLFGCLSNRQPY
ncbi:hypothetical protein T4B_11283 [Trichinella pseudospiralis]|uniref:Uncharacterized protein n=1 Tax=Trichinella pseudospiralis TaxID=6337 RepID=A0A0V1J889_TRIPS|nr:hypothetical protein T4B_11283 [Trichinella pseudospiralis]